MVTFLPQSKLRGVNRIYLSPSQNQCIAIHSAMGGHCWIRSHEYKYFSFTQFLQYLSENAILSQLVTQVEQAGCAREAQYLQSIVLLLITSINECCKSTKYFVFMQYLEYLPENAILSKVEWARCAGEAQGSAREERWNTDVGDSP